VIIITDGPNLFTWFTFIRVRSPGWSLFYISTNLWSLLPLNLGVVGSAGSPFNSRFAIKQGGIW